MTYAIKRSEIIRFIESHLDSFEDDQLEVMINGLLKNKDEDKKVVIKNFISGAERSIDSFNLSWILIS